MAQLHEGKPSTRPRSIIAVYALVILSGVLISATFYLFGIRPLSHLLEASIASQISHGLDDAKRIVDSILSRHRDLARQVASRSAIRRAQIDFLQGRIDRQALTAFSTPKLADAMNGSEEIAGIARHAPDGRLLVAVGEAIAPRLAMTCHAGSLTAVRPLPMQVSPLRLVYCSPIRDTHGDLVGFDVLTAFTDSIQQAIEGIDLPKLSFALASGRTDIAFRPQEQAHEAAMTALSLRLKTGHTQPGYIIKETETGIPDLSLFSVVDQEGFYAQIRDRLHTLLITLGVAASIILGAAVILLRPVIATLLHEQRLIEIASHDTLTGLLNWGAFHQSLDQELERARRYRHPLSLILFDIDFFKRVNDTHGHLVGDEVLQAIGRICPTLLRRTDICARYGGEEFAVILPETEEPHAETLANRLRTTIALSPITTTAGLVPVTVSGGVFTWHPSREDTSKETLIALADTALYASKAAGRNRVTVAAPPTA